MKSIYTLLFSTLISLSFLSCRHEGIPQDIHEHEEIERIVLSVSEVGSSAPLTQITYLGGKPDAPLSLEAGKTYEVTLDFFHHHEDHYENMLEEIIEEKDEHFITFEFAGVDMDLTRLPSDVVRSDGQRLGFKTQWSLHSAVETGLVSIKLYHGSKSVNANSPSAQKQYGEVEGGEADVNMQIAIQ